MHEEEYFGKGEARVGLLVPHAVEVKKHKYPRHPLHSFVEL